MKHNFKHIDVSYLNYTAAGDKKFMLDMIHMFETEAMLTSNEMKNAFESKNWHELHNIAHKAKNQLLIVGAKNLVDKMKDLQIWCENGTNTENYAQYVHDFSTGIKEIIDELAMLKSEL